MSSHRVVALACLVVAVWTASAAPARAQLVVDVRITVEVLAFSHDDRTALVSERFDTDVSTSARFLVVDANGVIETLPLTERVKMGAVKDGIPHATCEATRKRLEVLGRDFAGLSVVGLCSHPQRPLVKALQQPRAVVGDAELGKLHAKLGFVGQTWLSPRKTWALIVGRDFNNNPKIVTTRLDPKATP